VVPHEVPIDHRDQGNGNLFEQLLTPKLRLQSENPMIGTDVPPSESGTSDSEESNCSLPVASDDEDLWDIIDARK
jgi:hypothetical protein